MDFHVDSVAAATKVALFAASRPALRGKDVNL
jgi:hypothetical protein